MASRKKESTPEEDLAKQIIDQYQPKSVEINVPRNRDESNEWVR